MSTLLSGLADVPWKTLEHAYGAAEDTPRHLAALATGDAAARADARYWLSASIHHQGSLYSATAPAVPFLVRLASSSEVPERAWIVRFLADLAVSTPGNWLWSGFDLRAPNMQGYFAAPDAAPYRASYEAVESALPALLALLGDADAQVRGHAAFTVSFFARHAEHVRARLREALLREGDAAATASLLLALGLADGYLADASSQSLMRERLGAGGPLSLAAAIALCYGSAPAVGADPAALPVIRGALLARPAPATWPALTWHGKGTSPWDEGDLPAMALGHVYKLVPPEEHEAPGPRFAELLELYFPLFERVEEHSPAREIELAMQAMRPLFRMVTFAPPPPGGVTLATLRPTLRRFAENVARKPFLSGGGLLQVLPENGLPGELEKLQDFLGVRPRSLLDEEIEAAGQKRAARAWLVADAAAQAAFVEVSAVRPDAVALALALACTAQGRQVGKIGEMTFEMEPSAEQAAAAQSPLPARLVEAAVACDAAGAYAAALALAEHHAQHGPPKTHRGDVTQVHGDALLVLCDAAAAWAARTGEVPAPAFDAMLRSELGRGFQWTTIGRYLGILPAARRDAFLVGLAKEGFDFKENLERVIALLAPPERDELLAHMAAHGDFRAAARWLERFPSPAILEIVGGRIDGTLVHMEGFAKDDIPEQAAKDAALLAGLGLWAWPALRKLAASGLRHASTFGEAADLLDSRTHVGSALRGARIEARDARGLMPLGEARAWLEARATFRKGEGEMRGGTFVLESDLTWAALLSLEDAAELVRHATRLSWEFHVRGRENVAPFERYGAGILPWLESRLHPSGVLVNIPWCVVPCLFEIDSPAALALALRTHAIHELLPGQPPLGGGVGAFAHDEAHAGEPPAPPAQISLAEARTWLPGGDSLDVARSWIARHPGAYGTLARLADGGDVRAAALLADRARVLGDVVQEAIEAALGAEETSRLVARLGLPKVSLPPAVQTALAAAPTIDEPRGPLWSIAELDEAARAFDLPLWDNAASATGAMRVTGFASRHGDALVIESIRTWPAAGEQVSWHGCAFGPGVKTRQVVELLVDAAEDQLEHVELDGSDFVDGLTGNLTLFGERDESGRFVEGSHGRRVIAQPIPAGDAVIHLKRALLGMKGDEVKVPVRLPRSFAALPERERVRLRAVSPDEALLCQLCARHAEQMFAFDGYFAAAFGLPPDAKKLFQLSAFEWPAAGMPASSSIDVVTMVEALRRRRAIAALPGRANARPEAWLPAASEVRAYAGGDAWPPGEDPIEPELPATGVGCSPFWSWVITERAYPHGAILMHGPEWNAPGGAEQTVAYLVAQPGPVMQVYWPRRAALLWVRAIGQAEARWALDDAGIARALGCDLPLHPREAAALARRFVTRGFDPPAHAGAELVDLVEALVGGSATVDAFAAALAAAGPGAMARDRPALAAAVFELGFVLRRLAVGREAARASLAALWPGRADSDVARALDLVLHGREAADRSARVELDLAFVDDAELARERLLSGALAPSRPSAWLARSGGEALIDRWMARLAPADAPWLAVQLEKLGGARAVRALLELFTQHPATQDAVKQAFVLNRPGAKQELAAERRGPFGQAAATLLAAIEAEEQRRFDERYGGDDEQESEDAEESEDEDDGGGGDDGGGAGWSKDGGDPGWTKG